MVDPRGEREDGIRGAAGVETEVVRLPDRERRALVVCRWDGGKVRAQRQQRRPWDRGELREPSENPRRLRKGVGGGAREEEYRCLAEEVRSRRDGRRREKGQSLARYRRKHERPRGSGAGEGERVVECHSGRPWRECWGIGRRRSIFFLFFFFSFSFILFLCPPKDATGEIAGENGTRYSGVEDASTHHMEGARLSLAWAGRYRAQSV